MTKGGDYPYPPDEFDAVDPSAGPRGAHRRPRSRWATLWPYLVALVVSAALAFVVIGYLWEERGAPPAAAPAGVTDEQPEGADAGAPADPGTTPSEAPPAEPTVEPLPPAPDLAVSVTVMNSTSRPGLAAEAAERLQDAGWTEVQSGNFTGGTLPASTVRYGGPELEVSARAVAEALGIATVEAAEPGTTDGIEVVLELDYAG